MQQRIWLSITLPVMYNGPIVNGEVWIIETKGGESHGQDKNIDTQIANKFDAFKEYARVYHLHWGFVPDKDQCLYIDNTEFAEDMVDENLKPLVDVF